jgi:hypothetical protein
MQLATVRRRLADKTADVAFMRSEGIPVPEHLLSDIASLEAEVASVEAMAAAGVQVEVSVGQRFASSIDISARCHAGDHNAILDEQVEMFKRQMYGVIVERWPGCSPAESALGMACAGGVLVVDEAPQALPEGVPPQPADVIDVQFEPEPEPEPEPQPEPQP